MAAIAQLEQRLADGESPSPGLWEGDMGLALYLADCIDEQPDFPTLDYV